MRVIVADDEVKVRSAVRLLLEQELELSVVGEAMRADELQSKTALSKPDLVLVDWELPSLTTDHIVTLRSICPHLKIIALSGRPDSRGAALAAGVDAFVCKVGSPDMLPLAIRALMPPADDRTQSQSRPGQSISVPQILSATRPAETKNTGRNG